MDIVIVDDDAAIRQMLTEVLTEEGWTVHTAGSAERAWPLVGQVRPQVILLDQRLPGMSGSTFWQQLQAHPATQHIPVILMTAFLTHVPAGTPPPVVLAKPFTFATLLATLATVQRLP